MNPQVMLQQQQQQQYQAILMQMAQQGLPLPGMSVPHQQPFVTKDTQGCFSTYPARLKRSDDNALLLPASYTTGKRSRFAGGSDDEDLLDESDDEVPRTRAATAAAVAAVTAAPSDLEKTKRVKTHRNPLDAEEMEKIATAEEVLVPIRLRIDEPDMKLRDVFLWNSNEPVLTPERFAENLCADLNLPETKFRKPIVDSIREQANDFATVEELQLEGMEDSPRVIIHLDLQIGKVNLRDQFEWDLSNTSPNAPEIFSRQMASELGLGGEYVPIIAHAIREQLHQHKKRIVEEENWNDVVTSLASAFRKLEDASSWTPRLERLSNDELQKQLDAQGREMRRQQRERRSRYGTRGSSTPVLR